MYASRQYYLRFKAKNSSDCLCLNLNLLTNLIRTLYNMRRVINCAIISQCINTYLAYVFVLSIIMSIKVMSVMRGGTLTHWQSECFLAQWAYSNTRARNNKSTRPALGGRQKMSVWSCRKTLSSCSTAWTFRMHFCIWI